MDEKNEQQPQKAKRNICAKIFRVFFSDSARELARGAGLNATREFFKQLIVIFATCVASLVVAGVANFDWSLRSFDWFNKVNVVERANEAIRTDSVWQIPIGMTVQVKGTGFLTFKRYEQYYNAPYLSYVTTTGEDIGHHVATGGVLKVKDGCQTFSFLNMQTLNEKTY